LFGEASAQNTEFEIGTSKQQLKEFQDVLESFIVHSDSEFDNATFHHSHSNDEYLKQRQTSAKFLMIKQS